MVVFSNQRLGAASELFVSPEVGRAILEQTAEAARPRAQGRWEHELVQWLEQRSEVGLVLHPAFPDCPGHDYWKRDFKGSSGLFTFELKDAAEAARTRFIENLELFGIGYSWGGYESLAIHADPQLKRNRRSLPGPLLRLHIGLEDPDDLIADLRRGLDALSRP